LNAADDAGLVARAGRDRVWSPQNDGEPPRSQGSGAGIRLTGTLRRRGLTGLAVTW
jgi:hypothetical protein